MSVKLGACPFCLHPIYKAEGQADACDCDEGVLETIRLREATPKPRTASQKTLTRDGRELPELDITMLMSASALAELQGARAYSMSSKVAAEPELDMELLVQEGSPFDIEFSTGEEMDLPQAPAERVGRFRVDRGRPETPAWSRERVGGPSDGRVVGQVGTPLGRPQPRFERETWEPPPRPSAQEAVVVTNRREARVLSPRPARPANVPTALERLGSLEINDDPFR